jgi:hypothetical protein
LVPEPPTWFQRVVGRAADPRGATEAIKQLASSGGGTIDPSRVARELLKYGIESPDTQTRVKEAVFHAAVARLSSATDSRDSPILSALAQSLSLSRKSIQQTHAEAARNLLGEAVRELVSDRVFSIAEREHIHSLAKSLGISNEQRDDIIREELRPILSGAVDAVIADRRYSPDEERALQALANDLGIDLAFGERTLADLERTRAMWLAENGTLPEVFAPISLSRGEVCHYAAACSWQEMRTRTVRVDYAGVSGSVRIMKGVRVRIGSVAPRRVTSTELVEIAAGIIYVTSKRLVLDGTAGNKSVSWKSVFGQEIFSDAIKLEKSAGKDPYLVLPAEDIEYASVIIAAAMAAGS